MENKEIDLRGDISNENVIEWLTGQKTVTVSISQRKYVSRLNRLSEENPTEVEIVARNQDGSVTAHLPLSYIKISRPRQVSDEQKAAASERFKKIKNKKENI